MNAGKMYCEHYRCTMTEAACLKRQKLAGSGKQWLRGPRGNHFNHLPESNCAKCDHGRAVKNKSRKTKGVIVEIGDVQKAKTKACKTCGEVRPLTEYDRSKQTKDGRIGQCKPCRRIAQRQSSKRRKLQAKQSKPKPSGVVNSKHKISIDFTRHPELLEFLQEQAVADFRNIENQILFFVHSIAMKKEAVDGNKIVQGKPDHPL